MVANQKCWPETDSIAALAQPWRPIASRTFSWGLCGARLRPHIEVFRSARLVDQIGGGGGSRTRVRGFAAIGSTCLGSVYCFNRKRPGGQGAVGEPGRF